MSEINYRGLNIAKICTPEEAQKAMTWLGFSLGTAIVLSGFNPLGSLVADKRGEFPGQRRGGGTHWDIGSDESLTSDKRSEWPDGRDPGCICGGAAEDFEYNTDVSIVATNLLTGQETIISKKSRDEFPGRRQGGGTHWNEVGHNFVQPVDMASALADLKAQSENLSSV